MSAAPSTSTVPSDGGPPPARSSRRSRVGPPRAHGCTTGPTPGRPRGVDGDARRACAEVGDPVDHVDGEMEAIEVVERHHVERRRRRAFLLVAAHVDVVVVRAAVGQAVDQPGIAVVGEDDRTVDGEQGVELAVRHAVRMLVRRLQAHQVDDVDDADSQVGQMLAQDRRRRQHLERGYVTGARHHDVGFGAGVRRRPRQHADAAAAVQDRVVDGEPAGARLLAGDDDVHVVTAAQTVVGDGQQGVGVRRQVDADDLGLLVHDVVDEPGVLVGEAVVVLSPHVAGEQVVE